jgi:hypothetical protein
MIFLLSNPVSRWRKTRMRVDAHSFLSSVIKSQWAMLFLLLGLFFTTPSTQAQSLGYEGPTGIFVTPLASTAASPAHGAGHPVLAYHLLVGGPVIGTFNTVSLTEGFAKRFEAGYTREIHAQGDTAALSTLWTDGFNLFHGKATILDENHGKNPWVPAVAIGGIVRTNVRNVGGEIGAKDTTNGDIYLVATKIVTQTKKVPLVLNAGVRGTNASLWGLGGNAPNFEARAFGALGFVLTGPRKSTIILASEVAQQPRRIDVGGTPSFDIPTSIDYAARIVPLAERKLNVDFGVLQAAGRIAPGVDLKARARFALGVSYGF